MLPQRFSPTGAYSARVYDRTMAFRLLVHAEFEAYFEDRVFALCNSAYLDWQTTGARRKPIVALLAYCESPGGAPTSLLNPSAKPAIDLNDRVTQARNGLNTYVKTRNHGVKESNLLAMLLPVGITSIDLDMTWLAAIEAWATQRGQGAHKSNRVQVKVDPQAELQTVKYLLDGVRDLDRVLDKL